MSLTVSSFRTPGTGRAVTPEHQPDDVDLRDPQPSPDPEVNDLAAAIVASPHSYSKAAVAWAEASWRSEPPETRPSRPQA
jgi:hypothetical protein